MTKENKNITKNWLNKWVKGADDSNKTNKTKSWLVSWVMSADKK